MRKYNEYVIDYAGEDACVKLANVRAVKNMKSVKKCSPGGGGGGGMLPSAHKNTLRVLI